MGGIGCPIRYFKVKTNSPNFSRLYQASVRNALRDLERNKKFKFPNQTATNVRMIYLN